MAYCITCPKCKQKTHGFKTAPTQNPDGSFNYYTVNCRHCALEVFWVAGKECIPAKDPSKPRAEGWELSDILYAEPRVASGNPKGVADLLAKYATLEACYSQGERCDAFKSVMPALDKVKEGQCEGQSLHWIRRVLQGGKATYRVDRKNKHGEERDDSAIQQRQLKQTGRGAAIHLMVAPEQTNKISKERRDELNDKISAVLEKNGIKVTKTATGWSYSGGETLTQLEWDTYLAKAKQARTLVAEKGFYVLGWDQVAKAFDSKAPSKRPFSGIVATKSQHEKPYPEGIVKFVQTLVNDSDFHSGSAALIGVGLAKGVGEAGGSISGHAIAVHYKSDSEFYLFDPNIGVFMSRTKNDLKQALKLLIDDGWITILKWTLNNEFGYSLFEPRETPQSVGVKETPIVVTPTSPVVTYHENKKVIPTKVTGTTATPSITPTTPVTSSQMTSSPPTSVKNQKFAPQGPPQIGNVTKTQPGGGLKGELQTLLQQAKSHDTKVWLEKKGGATTQDGKGYVRVSADLIKKLKTANLQFTGKKWGDSPMGDTIQVGELEMLVNAAK